MSDPDSPTDASQDAAPRDLLAIDVGNTRVKLGWFPALSGACVAAAEGGALPIAAPRLPEPTETWGGSVSATRSGALSDWLGGVADSASPPRVVLASVSRPAEQAITEAITEWFVSGVVVETLASENALLALRVTEPALVGVDRVVAAIAANRLRQPERAAIVIDVGTAITVDLVAADGALEGGAILPGPALSARALAEATDPLPDIDFGELDGSPDAVGRATEPAMRAGIYWGAVGAIRELIARQADRLTAAPQVFVTGGAAPAFARLLGGPDLAVRYAPHLTLAGVAIAAGSIPAGNDR